MASTPTTMNQLGNALGLNLSQLIPSVTSTGSVTTLGFYGVTPIARPTAYTQTYATASKTVANPPSLIGVDYASEAGSIQDALNSLASNINALIDDLQALGLVQ